LASSTQRDAVPSAVAAALRQTSAEATARDELLARGGRGRAKISGVIGAAVHWRRLAGTLSFALVFVGVVAAVFLGLWMGKHKGRYVHHFERRPAGLLLTSDILDCPGDPRAYWAAKNAPTSLCIFSSSPELAETVQATELDVQRRCSARTDCGGYVRRQTVSATVCGCEASCASENVIQQCPHCVLQSYNSGRAEYVMYGKRAARNLEAVPDETRGPNHETVTTFLQKT